MLRSFSIFFAVMLFFFGFAAAFSQDVEQTINVESTLVVINAYVTDSSGSPVSGIRQGECTILENGVVQPISFFSAEETPFAAAILLDTSGSMEERISLARSAAIRFLDGLRAEDSAAIYRFESKVVLVQDFSNSRDVGEKIFDLKSDGMTALNDAISIAVLQLSVRAEKRKAIIVLSDGEDTFSRNSADKALKAALDANVTIYTVDMSSPSASGTSLSRNRNVLKNFAEKTGGKYLSTPGGSALRESFGKIVAELRTQYTLAYEPLDAKKDGKWRAIELRISMPNLFIRTRKGYNAAKAKK